MITPQLGLWATLICLAWGYGYHRHQAVTEIETKAPRKLQAAAIQANIGDFDKLAAERGASSAATRILDLYMDLSRQALVLHPTPDVIIWPETSYPSTFRTPRSFLEMKLDERVENFVKEIQTPLLFGGYDHVNNKDYNSFFFLSPNGELQTYHKSILLIFGEYIPGAEIFPWIKEAFPQVGNFGQGFGADRLMIRTKNPEHPPIFAGPMICYEALFTSFVVDSAKKGSEFFMNITNDSWFGKWGEPQLHLALSVFRSIETRLPMLRATNTGVSALIHANGDLTHQTELDTQKILNVTVPITDPIPTLIKQWGDWFGLLAFWISLISLGSLAVARAATARSAKKSFDMC